jgi:hypothetical protein
MALVWARQTALGLIMVRSQATTKPSASPVRSRSLARTKAAAWMEALWPRSIDLGCGGLSSVAIGVASNRNETDFRCLCFGRSLSVDHTAERPDWAGEAPARLPEDDTAWLSLVVKSFPDHQFAFFASSCRARQRSLDKAKGRQFDPPAAKILRHATNFALPFCGVVAKDQKLQTCTPSRFEVLIFSLSICVP